MVQELRASRRCLCHECLMVTRQGQPIHSPLYRCCCHSCCCCCRLCSCRCCRLCCCCCCCFSSLSSPKGICCCRCLCRCLCGCHPAGICFCLWLRISFSRERNPVISTGAAQALESERRRPRRGNPNPSYPHLNPTRKISTEIFNQMACFQRPKKSIANHAYHTFHRVLTTKTIKFRPFSAKPHPKTTPKKSHQKHAIPIRKKPVPLSNSMSISSQNPLPARKSTHQHQ